ncbi:uncharacterized protein LOC144911407 isoform X3 [Branchiostoma floridae x Branchiostoma belcheri]
MAGQLEWRGMETTLLIVAARRRLDVVSRRPASRLDPRCRTSRQSVYICARGLASSFSCFVFEFEVLEKMARNNNNGAVLLPQPASSPTTAT